MTGDFLDDDESFPGYNDEEAGAIRQALIRRTSGLTLTSAGAFFPKPRW